MKTLSVGFSGRVGQFPINVAFEAPLDGVTALFGASGSGKTTVLRAIAGLERLKGRCALGDQVWQDELTYQSAHRRAIGYVFQEASLFAHLSVRKNLMFGMKGPDADGFARIVDLLRIAPLLDRMPAKLSGGERQRVSLGRALLSQPELLLLDEPMSALDRQAKAEIMPYFASLHKNLGIPIILVSHDMAEVEQLADHMVVLASGTTVTAGPLNAVLTENIAGLWRDRDAASVLTARVLGFDADDQLAKIRLGAQQMLVGGQVGEMGDEVRVRIAARDVSLAIEKPSPTTILNCLKARIKNITTLDGPDAAVTLWLEGQVLLARVTQRSVRALGLVPEQDIYAQVKGVSVLTSTR